MFSSPKKEEGGIHMRVDPPKIYEVSLGLINEPSERASRESYVRAWLVYEMNRSETIFNRAVHERI